VRLGDALVELDYLDKIQVDHALAEFFDAEDRIEPEVVTIPPDMPGQEIAFELFYLAHKLLLRACDLVSKTEALRIHEGPVSLSERNVRIDVSGAYLGYVVLCVPEEIAEATAARFCGEQEPAEDDIRNVVVELGRLLTANLRSIFAERGQRLVVADPVAIPDQLSLAAGEKLAMVPFLTHQGQVLIGMRLA
jgi:CheY-specific phosphatase CheX